MIVADVVIIGVTLYVVFPGFRYAVDGFVANARGKVDDARRSVRRLTEEEWVREMRKVRGLD
jgi:hypothetical protein